MLHRNIALVLFGLLASCGARSALRAEGPEATDAGRDAPTTDTALPVDAGPCAWQPGAVRRITPMTEYDKSLHSVLPIEGGALVAWGISNDPSPTLNRMVQRVDEDGATVGEANPLLVIPSSVSYGGLALAEGFGRRAAVAWDEVGGCRFVRLDAAGAASGPERVVGNSLCGRLSATASGWVLLETNAPTESSPTAPVFLSPEGAVLRRGASLVPTSDEAFWTARRLTSDEGLFVAWMPGGFSATRVLAQRFRADGTAASPTRTAATLSAVGARVAITPVSDGFLLAWMRREGPSDQDHRIELVATDASGSPRGAPRPLAGPVAYRDAGLSLLQRDGGVFLAWVQSATGTSSTLWVTPLTAAGAASGAAIQVATGRFVRTPVLAPTASGLLVVYQTPLDSFRSEVAAQPLRCVR